MSDPHPCLQCRNGAHIRREITDVQALSLVEQFECGVGVALGVTDASHRHGPTRPVRREPGALAELFARRQVFGGGKQIAVLTFELAHADIQVRRPSRRWLALGLPKRATTLAKWILRRRELQRVLIRAHCLTKSTLRNAYVRLSDCARDGVRDVPGAQHIRHASGIGPVR